MKTGPNTYSLEESFFSHVSPEPNTGCWLWDGPVFKLRGGYGVLTHRPSKTIMRRAHRVSWEIHNGKIIQEEHVLHKCDNPLCVNPDHLFLGDQKTNMEDMSYKGRQTYGKKNPHYKHGKYVGQKQNPKYHQFARL
jgi:hypothetical protein